MKCHKRIGRAERHSEPIDNNKMGKVLYSASRERIRLTPPDPSYLLSSIHHTISSVMNHFPYSAGYNNRNFQHAHFIPIVGVVKRGAHD